MRAAYLYGQEDLRLQETTQSPLEPGGLRLRVVACGLCGSDARMYFSGPSPRYINPVILGHEFCGEIVEVGAGVSNFETGDLVAVAPLIPCLSCPACLRGMDNICQNGLVIGCNYHGAMADFFDLPAQMVRSGGAMNSS